MNAGNLCKANPKASGSLAAPQLGHATTVLLFCAHCLILIDLDCHQNLIGSSSYQDFSITFHANLFKTFSRMVLANKHTRILKTYPGL